MRIESASIKNVRSIQDIKVNNLSNINIFIGKNNSGKSNILLSMYSFFKNLESHVPIVLNPTLGERVDYFQEKTQHPIAIRVVFQKDPTEIAELINNVVEEAPQVANAAEQISENSKICVEINIVYEPIKLAFVSEISLVTDIHNQRRILKIPLEAALEFAEQETRISELESHLSRMEEFYGGFDEDDWRRLGRSESPRYAFRRIYGEAEGLVRDALEQEKSFAQFQLSLESSMNEKRDLISSIKQENIKTNIESFSGNQNYMPQYAIKILEKISKTKILYMIERREEIGKSEAIRLLDLKIRKRGSEQLRMVQDTVKSLLGVEIDAYKPDDVSIEDDKAQLDIDNFMVQVNGAGIREALRLVLDYEFNEPNILLIEEPEIHLHPALEISMMQYLESISKKCQIFLTTHSTNFINMSNLENVYLVSQDNFTNVTYLNLEKALEELPRELGLRLSSVFMFERLVFVEGPTDEDVIRRWSNKLGLNLAHSNVGFIPMGGIRNLAYFANETILGFLSRRQVGTWFVLDRDERNQEEIEKMEEKLSGTSQMHIFQKREIENYFIKPKALSLFIQEKKALKNMPDTNAPELDEIQQAIESNVEKLKDIAIERRVMKDVCLPIYLNRKVITTSSDDSSFEERVIEELLNQRTELENRRESLHEIVEEKRQYIEHVWQGTDLEAKIALIPGDELLKNICEDFEVSFKKDKDSARLAEFMDVDEIDPEIRDLLQSFVE
jgi:predicted ATP-dependent endonuclease of OLD family